MEVLQGYSYHIKDEFFELVKDDKLMSNKEGGSYRPHYYAIQDTKNQDIYWMIPISSQADKYKRIIQRKIEKYGKCNTVVIGKFAGNQNVFLIQNAFPIVSKYFDHIHVVENKPVQIHNELAKTLRTNLKDVLALRKRGINLVFTDIDKIMELMLKEIPV